MIAPVGLHNSWTASIAVRREVPLVERRCDGCNVKNQRASNRISTNEIEGASTSAGDGLISHVGVVKVMLPRALLTCYRTRLVFVPRRHDR